MKAAAIYEYGNSDKIKIIELDKPKVKSKEVLIKVMSSSINSADSRIRRANPWLVRLMYGLRKPKYPIIGIVYAGIIEELGSEVTSFKVGDRIYGMREDFLGTQADYCVLDANKPIGRMPEEMDFNDAAALPFGFTTALHFLKGINLKNKSVLINGASGAVGLAFIQVATIQFAKITAVCSSKNFDLIRTLGVEEIIDYQKIDIVQANKEFDIVIDCVNTISLKNLEKLVKIRGDIFIVAGLIKEMIFSNLMKKANVHIGTAVVTQEQYETINKLYLESNLRPIISKVFAFEEIREANRIVDEGHKVGSIIVEIN